MTDEALRIKLVIKSLLEHITNQQISLVIFLLLTLYVKLTLLKLLFYLSLLDTTLPHIK